MLPSALGGLRARVPPVPGRLAPRSMEKINVVQFPAGQLNCITFALLPSNSKILEQRSQLWGSACSLSSSPSFFVSHRDAENAEALWRCKPPPFSHETCGIGSLGMGCGTPRSSAAVPTPPPLPRAGPCGRLCRRLRRPPLRASPFGACALSHLNRVGAEVLVSRIQRR